MYKGFKNLTEVCLIWGIYSFLLSLSLQHHRSPIDRRLQVPPLITRWALWTFIPAHRSISREEGGGGCDPVPPPSTVNPSQTNMASTDAHPSPLIFSERRFPFTKGSGENNEDGCLWAALSVVPLTVCSQAAGVMQM